MPRKPCYDRSKLIDDDGLTLRERVEAQTQEQRIREIVCQEVGEVLLECLRGALAALRRHRPKL